MFLFYFAAVFLARNPPFFQQDRVSKCNGKRLNIEVHSFVPLPNWFLACGQTVSSPDIGVASTTKSKSYEFPGSFTLGQRPPATSKVHKMYGSWSGICGWTADTEIYTRYRVSPTFYKQLSRLFFFVCLSNRTADNLSENAWYFHMWNETQHGVWIPLVSVKTK